MAFVGQVPIRSKIEMGSTNVETSRFMYLLCKISYKERKDVTSKINKFLQIFGILNSISKPNLVKRPSQLRFYKNMTVFWDYQGNDGGSKHLLNISQYLPDYMTQHLRRWSSSYSSL
jgi:hypothetical protein